MLEPAPIQTPLNQGGSMDPRTPNDQGLLTYPWIQWLNSLVNSINGGGGNGSQYVTDGVTSGDAGTVLSAGTNSIVSPTATPTEGDIWSAYLTQPAAGNALVTYAGISPAVHLVTTNDLDRRPNKVTVVTFMCRADGEWWLQSVLMGR